MKNLTDIIIEKLKIDKDSKSKNLCADFSKATYTLKDSYEFKNFSPNIFNDKVKSFLNKYLKSNKKVYVFQSNDNGNDLANLDTIILNHRKYHNAENGSSTSDQITTSGSIAIYNKMNAEYSEIIIISKNQSPKTYYWIIQN